jgi:hypothetical protein
MAPAANRNAQTIAGLVAAWPAPPGKVLDIAAGHGLFGILVAKAVPAAQVTAVDWGNVLMNGVFAYHTTVALKAAVELDLFSEGVAEPALLSNSTGISR